MALDLGEGHVGQLVVRYAAKLTPLSIPEARKEKLAKRVLEALVQVDSELFNSLQPHQPNSQVLALIARNIFLPTGAAISTISFSLDQGGMQLYVPRLLSQVPGEALQPSAEDRWLGSYDKAAVGMLFAVQDALQKEGVNVQLRRMGKIYDLTFGPFEENTAEALSSTMLGYPEHDSSEFMLRVAPKESNYHFRLEVTATGTPVPRFVQVSLDINNVDMSKSLEPRQMEAIFQFASKQMPNRLFEMLSPLKGV